MCFSKLGEPRCVPWHPAEISHILFIWQFYFSHINFKHFQKISQSIGQPKTQTEQC